jgi:D-glycero-D-manno-heptose 1,7-bisphosphate phosphatase
VAGTFIDIGRPEPLARVRRELLRIDRRPCAFLDRDGTLNVDAGYTHRCEDLVWVKGAKAAVRRLNDRGYRVIVCTNQSGIARGRFDEAAMHRFHRAMRASLAEDGAFIDAFYFCPYHVDGVVEGLRGDHPDRKPHPGMLLRAMSDWAVDASRSFMIGDQPADTEAAAAAGVAGYRYTGGSLLAVVEQALADSQRR